MLNSIKQRTFIIAALLTIASLADATVKAVHPTFLKNGTVERSPRICDCDAGEPLILTPFITSGRIKEARRLSRAVIPELNGTGPTGYSGFLTVNDSDGGNLFFWYFEHVDFATKPLLIWLQGGPGSSSIYGLLLENGPYQLGAKARLKLRGEYSWSHLANLVYIDNPVMAGFSFTNSSEGYARDQVQIGWALHRFLLQFYQLFPYLRLTDLILTGESYAGKYLPALAHRIDLENRKSTNRLPLAAIAMGNAMSDPVNMYTAYGPMLYEMGRIDRNEQRQMDNLTATSIMLINDGRRADATHMWDDTMELYKNMTGLNDIYNVRNVDDPWATDGSEELFARCDIRRALHVGRQEYSSLSSLVRQWLLSDITDSVAEWMPNLFDRYRWLLYNGQWDVAVGVAVTDQMLERMQWRGKAAFERAVRRPWKVEENDAEVAGFVQQAGDIAQVVVRDSGHIVPADQPRRAFDMMRRFVYKVRFT